MNAVVCRCLGKKRVIIGAPEFFSRGQISKRALFVKKALQEKSIIATMSQSN